MEISVEVLTHNLCLLIIRSMSSFIFLYLSSDSGLWPTESSASGSGLSQPFRPFFLNVCGQSKLHTKWLKYRYGRGEGGGSPWNTAGAQRLRDEVGEPFLTDSDQVILFENVK